MTSRHAYKNAKRMRLNLTACRRNDGDSRKRGGAGGSGRCAVTDGNDEVDDEAAHFGEHDGGQGRTTSKCDRTSQHRGSISTENRGYSRGRSPLSARGCRGRSHKRPLPPKAYFKIDQGARGIPQHMRYGQTLRPRASASTAGDSPAHEVWANPTARQKGFRDT